LLLITIREFSLECGVGFSLQVLGPNDRISGPPDAGALIKAQGVPCQSATKSPDIPAGGVLQSAATRCKTPAERVTADDLADCTGASSFDSLRMAGGPRKVSGGHLECALGVIGGTVADLFPPNKIAVRCAVCRRVIPRYKGYRHIKVGIKKTYCASCHEKMGLPLRDELIGLQQPNR
jgi:hypothetical protein